MGKSAQIPSATQPSAAKGVRPQQSTYGDPILIQYGEGRIAPHIIWGDFFHSKELANPTSGASSKADAGTASGQFNYWISVFLMLGEGVTTNFDNPSRPLEIIGIGLARPGRQAVAVLQSGSVVDVGDWDVDDSTTNNSKIGAAEIRPAGPDGRVGQPITGAEPGCWRGKVVRAVGPKIGVFGRTHWFAFAGSNGTIPLELIHYVTLPTDLISDAIVDNSPRKQHTKITTVGSNWFAPERYPGKGCMAMQDMFLGQNAALPNWNMPYFRMRFQETDGLEGMRDATPDRILTDLLTNWKHGAGFDKLLTLFPGYDPALKDASPFWNTAPNEWGQYCRGRGLFISPTYDQQQSMRAILDQLCMVTDTACVYSEGLVKMIPWGDAEEILDGGLFGHYVPASGVTPYTTGAYIDSRADFQMDDFLVGQDNAAVTVIPRSVLPDERSSPGYFNDVSVEHETRANAYAKGVVYASDSASISAFGRVTRQPFTAPEIKSPEIAQGVAKRLIMRYGQTPNEYHFTVGWWWEHLEPMDPCTIPGESIDDPSMRGRRIALRIQSITEDQNFNRQIVAVKFPRAIKAATPVILPGPTIDSIPIHSFSRLDGAITGSSYREEAEITQPFDMTITDLWAEMINDDGSTNPGLIDATVQFTVGGVTSLEFAVQANGTNSHQSNALFVPAGTTIAYEITGSVPDDVYPLLHVSFAYVEGTTAIPDSWLATDIEAREG